MITLSASETNHPFAISASKLRPLLALTEKSGNVLHQFLAEIGLSPDLLKPGTRGSVGLADYFRILERISLEIQDETCRLSSRPLMPGSTHFVWSGVAGESSLEAAMKRVAQAYNMLHGGHYNHVRLDARWLTYIVDDRGFPYTQQDEADYIQFFLECVLVFLHGTLMLVAGDELNGSLRKVWSRRPRPASRSAHLDFLGVPIRWGSSSYALIYDAPAANLPVQVSSSDLPAPNAVYRKLIELIESDEFGTTRPLSTADRVVEALTLGIKDQGRIARELGMSVATLRRRLAAEGANFRNLRREALDREARTMLCQGQHVTDVADALGFSDFRSFTRAFKDWNGRTPAQFAKIQRN